MTDYEDGENPTEYLDPNTYPTSVFPQRQQPQQPTGAPGAAPDQPQLNPAYMGYQGHPGAQQGQGGWGGRPYYGYPGPYAQPQPGYAAQHPKKRTGLFWGLGAIMLAAAVVLGGLPGYALGHNSGLHQGRNQAQSQQLPGNGEQQGPGDNPGQQPQFPGEDSPGGDIENLPFNEYGNGQGNNSWGGKGSSITEGTKMAQGQDGFVVINTAMQGGRGAGTGLILDASGTVLTNYHVVEGSETVKVTDSVTKKTYEASVEGRDQTKDVAVLKLKGASGLKTVDLADGGVKEGDSIAAVGNASGQGYLSKLEGKVTGTQQSITTRSEAGSAGSKLNNLIETDADVVPGYSGGAFVNSKGQVVGMTTAASAGKTSEQVDGYAIPISDAMTIVKKVQAGDDSGTTQIGRAAALGISVLAADSGDVGGGYGVTVNGLLDGGSATKLGIKEGDTIVGLDGKSVKSFPALKEILAQHKPGDSVELVWLDANGKQTKKDITLGESSVN